jgi:hypothetical protein
MPAFLRIALLRLDGDTQPRLTINCSVVEEYAERLQAGDRFPLVIVFFDGEHHWLGDGFHRVFAHQSAGLEYVEADHSARVTDERSLVCLQRQSRAWPAQEQR